VRVVARFQTSLVESGSAVRLVVVSVVVEERTAVLAVAVATAAAVVGGDLVVMVPVMVGAPSMRAQTRQDPGRQSPDRQRRGRDHQSLYRICGHSREGKLSRQECFGACQAVWRPRCCCCSAGVRLWLRAADRALASVPATTAILVDRLLQPGCEGELFFVGRSSVISSTQARRMSSGV